MNKDILRLGLSKVDVLKGWYNCFDVDTGNNIGTIQVKPEPGQEHYFGEQLYKCISCGDIAIFALFADWNHD